jgi:hypothetical protein
MCTISNKLFRLDNWNLIVIVLFPEKKKKKNLSFPQKIILNWQFRIFKLWEYYLNFIRMSKNLRSMVCGSNASVSRRFPPFKRTWDPWFCGSNAFVSCRFPSLSRHHPKIYKLVTYPEYLCKIKIFIFSKTNSIEFNKFIFLVIFI